jgi:hypothetical protein
MNWLCWILAAFFAALALILWMQLLKWRNWKNQIADWIKAYKAWVAANCDCNQTDPPPTPPPPTWPNGWTL